MYINGVLVPSTKSGAGTSITQGGSLQVGAANSTSFFDGYSSEVRVWSAVQSQANIQANMTISLTGSETNLVALFQGNGNFNDKTANANTLTANGGAVATQAANPYNNIEYAIITAITSSQLTLFTGTDYTIPNMTLSGPQYSNARAPYGFPNDRNKWIVDSLANIDATQSSPTSGTLYNIGPYQLTVPTGAWELGYEASVYVTRAGGSADVTLGLSTSNTSYSDPTLVGRLFQNSTDLMTVNKRETGVTLASQTLYYFCLRPNAVTTTSIQLATSFAGVNVLRARCAYI